MLRKAAVQNSVVLVVGVDDGALEPLVVLVADEALAILQLRRAVHLAVGAVVGAESLVLADCVFHKGATVVHLRVDDLAASPLVSGEGSLVNMHDLEPGAHEMFLFKFIDERGHGVAHHVLGANLSVVD